MSGIIINKILRELTRGTTPRFIKRDQLSLLRLFAQYLSPSALFSHTSTIHARAHAHSHVVIIPALQLFACVHVYTLFCAP